MPNRAGKTGDRTAPQAGGGAALETTAKYVGHSDGRTDRFRHQRHAAKLFGGGHRVGQCRYSVVSRQAGVDVVSSSYGEGKPDRSHYEGLQTCGSVWVCPCCGARISETRREELGKLLSWARAAGHKVRMMTLTARHGKDDILADLVMRLKGRGAKAEQGITAFRGAKQRLVQDRRYKRLKPLIVGTVTATEVTGGGAHGWHPHLHVIMILREDVDLTPLRDAWLAALRGAGLDGNGNGWDVRDADETGKYIAKWGAAEELALSHHKKGRAGRTPAQLLAASCDDGDKAAGVLWREYAAVFQGKRQLVWSDGLKSAVGLDEVEDADAAQDAKQDQQIEIARANIPHPAWVRSVASRREDRRGEFLARSEEVGPETAVSELISGPAPDDQVIEEDQPLAAPPVLPGSIRDILMRSIWTPEDFERVLDHIEPCERSVTAEMRIEAIARSKERLRICGLR